MKLVYDDQGPFAPYEFFLFEIFYVDVPSLADLVHYSVKRGDFSVFVIVHLAKYLIEKLVKVNDYDLVVFIKLRTLFFMGYYIELCF